MELNLRQLLGRLDDFGFVAHRLLPVVLEPFSCSAIRVLSLSWRPASGATFLSSRAQHQGELARLAGLIRARLATFRSFDAAQRARGEDEPQ